MKIRQFDIWLADLNPSKGSEQNGKRPCIILQTNAGHDYGSTTIIAPCTTKKLSRVYAFEVKINPSRQNGLTEKSKIKFDQIRVIDKARLVKKLGGLENIYHDDALTALKIIFDIEQDFTFVGD